MSAPVLVVGTGRSGTSTVARLLQSLGVTMYREEFLKADKWNPEGYYEDRQMKSLVKAAICGDLSAAEFAIQARDWMTVGADVEWGFKITQMVHLSPDYLRALDPRRIVACVRERVATGKSIAAWWRQSRKIDDGGVAQRKADERMAGLLQLLHGHEVLWLDFSVPRYETELLRMLEVYLAFGNDASLPAHGKMYSIDEGS